MFHNQYLLTHATTPSLIPTSASAGLLTTSGQSPIKRFLRAENSGV